MSSYKVGDSINLRGKIVGFEQRGRLMVLVFPQQTSDTTVMVKTNEIPPSAKIEPKVEAKRVVDYLRPKKKQNAETKN